MRLFLFIFKFIFLKYKCDYSIFLLRKVFFFRKEDKEVKRERINMVIFVLEDFLVLKVGVYFFFIGFYKRFGIYMLESENKFKNL